MYIYIYIYILWWPPQPPELLPGPSWAPCGEASEVFLENFGCQEFQRVGFEDLSLESWELFLEKNTSKNLAFLDNWWYMNWILMTKMNVDIYIYNSLCVPWRKISNIYIYVNDSWYVLLLMLFAMVFCKLVTGRPLESHGITYQEVDLSCLRLLIHSRSRLFPAKIVVFGARTLISRSLSAQKTYSPHGEKQTWQLLAEHEKRSETSWRLTIERLGSNTSNYHSLSHA